VARRVSPILVYLARSEDDGPLITPNFLWYAYRRTAAIVGDDGRRDIDFRIPVRSGKDDKFVGFCGLDKNRADDTVEGLVHIGTTRPITMCRPRIC
jgi:hypothetical protein